MIDGLQDWLDVCRDAASMHPEYYEEWVFMVGLQGSYRERAEAGRIILNEIKLSYAGQTVESARPENINPLTGFPWRENEPV